MKLFGWGRTAAVFGIILTSIMILVKLVPLVPGHFTWHEWVALAIWGVLGTAIHRSRNQSPSEEVAAAMADAAS